MLKTEDDLIQSNALLDLRKKKKEQLRFDKAKKLIFNISIFLSLAIIILIYFLSDYSNIYRIVVNGNKYLNEQQIIELSDLSNKDKYLLTIPYFVEKRIKENPIIESCNVTRANDSLVIIDVEEKKAIAYTYENNIYYLLLQDNLKIELDQDNMFLITNVPLIEGFSQEEITLIENNLQACDYNIINEISEIRKYPDLKYQNVELIMRDGNYIFTSVYGLDMLNHYYSIQSSYVTNKQVCYYFEDISGNAYSSACPWQQEEVKEDIDQEENS